MKDIFVVQMEQEAKDIIQYNESTIRTGKNKPKHNRNSYALTLRYFFAIRDLTYKDVAEALGVTIPAITYLINKADERVFKNMVFMKKFCDKFNIDYKYFCEISEKVKEIM